MNKKKLFCVFSHNRSRARKISRIDYCGHYALQQEGCVLRVNIDLCELPNQRGNKSEVVCGDMNKLRTNL